MFWFCYNALFHGLYLLMLPHFLLRMRRRGGYRKDFGERWFRVSEPKRKALSEHRRLWIHAVSVGEWSVARAFMLAWREAHPQARFLITVNTSTAHRLAEAQCGEEDVLLYPPLDSPWVISRMLSVVRPEALVLVETELWPNLLRGLRKRGVPVMLLNGRLSDRSTRRLQKVPAYTRRLYALVDLYCMQSQRDAERIQALGAAEDRIRVMHSAKYDVAKRTPEEEQVREARLRNSGFLTEHSRVVLGSSTWPGEEAELMRSLQTLRTGDPDLRLILVPRHFERAADVMEEARQLGVSMVKWSTATDGDLKEAEVLLVDTTGELMHFTGIADRVFVGKSLFRPEGQNPIEAACAGAWLCTGPGMNNFRAVMEDLREARAVYEVQSAEDLLVALRQSFEQPEEAAAQGQRARELVEQRKGVIHRSVQALEDLVSA